jgi:hypothetical protein
MDQPLGRKWVKGKIPDFFTQVQKRAMNTPSPNQYQKNLQVIGKEKKFFWSKLDRTSEIDTIMKKNKTGPSPFSYNPEQIKSRKKIFQSKLERNGFIEDAKARGKDTPAPYIVKYTRIEPRVMGSGFLPSKKTNMDPIKKKNVPDMGTYTTDKSFEKVIKRIRHTSIPKYKIPSVQDVQLKRKKYVPGVGSYNWDKCFDHTTRAPLFRKGKY